jgi:hypothetical protein
MVSNKGVTTASCKTEIDGNKPVGGTNWALSFDMPTYAEAFGPKDSNKTYDDVMASVFYVATKRPVEGRGTRDEPVLREALPAVGVSSRA